MAGLPVVGVRLVVKGANRANQQLSAFRRALLNVKKVAAAAPIKALSASFGGLLRVLPRVGFAIRNVGKQFTRFGRSITTFGSVLSTLGFRLASFISLPIGLAIGGMISQAAKFEEKMTGLITTIGLGRPQVEGLTERLLELGPALGIDLLELADSAYITLSSTIRDSATALEIVEGSAKASAIGLGESADIAKLVTAVIVAYGQENITAAEALDTLLAGVQRGAIEADEMVEPLSSLIGLTSNLGVSFAELQAFVGTFGASGASASQSVTGMLGVMRALLNPTKQMTDALALMNTNVNELRSSIAEDGLAVTLVGLVREMNRLGIDVSDVFGRIQGLNAALFLSGEASDEYLKNLVEIQNGQGVLEASFAVTTQSTVFQWNQLKATIQAAAITMGSILLPAVNQIIQALMPLVAAIAAVAKEHPGLVKVAVVFAILAAAIGPVIIISGLLLSSIGAIVTAVGVLISALGAILTPIGLIAAAFLAAATAIGVLFLGSIKKTAEKLGFQFDDMAERAESWGRNILISLARGMAQGAIAVVTVLIEIGNIIRGWLSPGSPPKLLPELPEWGANIINSLLSGFSLADFSIFNELAGTISSFFRSLPTSKLNKEGLIPAIIGGRAAIKKALEEVAETGNVTQKTLNKIAKGFGKVSKDIKRYALLLIELAKAQKLVSDAQSEINRINDEFKIASAPLNKELGEISERRQEIKDALEEERLQKILDDPRAPALAKELALMDLRELALNRSVRDLEKERDTKLDVAKAALKAAEAEAARIQEQIDLQKLLIDEQIEHNNLLKERESILKSLAEAMKKAKEEVGPLPGAGGLVLPELPEADPLSLADVIGDALQEQIESQGDVISGIIADIKKEFEPLLALWGEATDVWSDIFAAVLDFENLDWKGLGDRTVAFLIESFWQLVDEADKILDEFLFQFDINLDTQGFQEIGRRAVDAVIDGLGELGALAVAEYTRLISEGEAWLVSLGETGLKQLGIDAANFMLVGLEQLFIFVSETLPEWLGRIGTWIGEVDWFALGKAVTEKIIDGLEALSDFVIITLPAFKQTIFDWFTSPDRNWAQLGVTLIQGIIDGAWGMFSSLLQALVDIIAGAISAALAAVGLNADVDVGNLPDTPNTRGFDADPGIRGLATISPMGGTTTSSVNNFNMGPVNVTNGMDMAQFEAAVRRIFVDSFA